MRMNVMRALRARAVKNVPREKSWRRMTPRGTRCSSCQGLVPAGVVLAVATSSGSGGAAPMDRTAPPPTTASSSGLTTKSVRQPQRAMKPERVSAAMLPRS